MRMKWIRQFDPYAIKIYTIVAFIFIVGFLLGYTVAYADTPQPTTVLEEPVVITRTIPESIRYDVPLSVELQQEVENLCAEYDFDARMIYGIMAVESNFTSGITSDNVHVGLMQINRNYTDDPIRAREDDVYNIRWGFKILDDWRTATKSDDPRDWLECYNRGWEHLNSIVPTYNYSEKVLDYAKKVEVL